MTVLELQGAIGLKIQKVVVGHQSIEAITDSIEQFLESQRQLAASFDLGESVEIIRDAIVQGKMEESIKSLELIQRKFSNDLKNEALQLISRYHELSSTEMIGIESPLMLYPQKNKHSFNLLRFLESFHDQLVLVLRGAVNGSWFQQFKCMDPPVFPESRNAPKYAKWLDGPCSLHSAHVFHFPADAME